MDEYLLKQFYRFKTTFCIIKNEGIKNFLIKRRQRVMSEKKYRKILASSNIINGLIETQILGYKMKLSVNDLGISRELLIDRIHEKEAVEILCPLLPDKMTIMDIGANLGFYALLEASLTPDDARIFAIEPSPSNVLILRNNIKINNYEDKIEIFELGITNYVGTANFYLENFSNRNHIDKFKTTYEIRSNKSIEIKVTTLDNFCKENMIKEINLLRIDVEGHEYAIIEGAHKILDQSKNCTIFMELHPWSLSELGKDPLFLLETLRDSGFKCIAVCGTEGNKPLIMPNWHYLISNLHNLVDHYGNKIFLCKN